MLQILLLGDSDRPEMASAVEAMTASAPKAEFKHAANVAKVFEITAESDWYPELAVVFQNWPDEFPQSDVERLLGELPLIRWVCCFGAWCESDGRNRTTWPHSTRVPARRAADCIRRELEVVQGHCRAVPLTASRDEVFEASADGDSGMFETAIPEIAEQTVTCVSADPELRRWLASLVATAGYRVLADSDVSQATLVLCDVDPWDADSAADLRSVREQNQHAAIVALMAFAHPDDVDSIKASGANAVVTKLATRQVLLHALSEAVNSNAPSS